MSLHLIGFIVVVRAIFSFLGFHHQTRQRLARRGFRATVCHPEVNVCSPTTPGLGSAHARLVNFRRLHGMYRSGDDVMEARKQLWRSRMAMAGRLAGASARALADGSHV